MNSNSPPTSGYHAANYIAKMTQLILPADKMVLPEISSLTKPSVKLQSTLDIPGILTKAR
jgi:hypothetical protein